MADYNTFNDGELEEFAKEEQRKQILREVQACLPADRPQDSD